MRANLNASIDLRFGSQIAFARAVAMHPVRINRLCKGWVKPTQTERKKIADALGVNADWLFADFRIPSRRAAAINQIPNTVTVSA